MNTKWTPGPWSVDDDSITIRAPDALGGEPWDVAAVTEFCGDNPDIEVPANARLIAAAPELYEALFDARSRFYSALAANGTSPEMALIACEKMDTALAKARGEA